MKFYTSHENNLRELKTNKPLFHVLKEFFVFSFFVVWFWVFCMDIDRVTKECLSKFLRKYIDWKLKLREMECLVDIENDEQRKNPL